MKAKYAKKFERPKPSGPKPRETLYFGTIRRATLPTTGFVMGEGHRRQSIVTSEVDKADLGNLSPDFGSFKKLKFAKLTSNVTATFSL
jgi:hypothetical protein